MNPFPALIFSPSTANRLPRTLDAEGIIKKLLMHEVNAAAFLMDEDLLAAAEAKGFKNNLERALTDLFSQLPRSICEAVFPPVPDPEFEEEDSSDDGRDSPSVRGLLLKISNTYSVSPESPQISPPPKKLNPLSHTSPSHRFYQPDPKKKQRSGLSLGR